MRRIFRDISGVHRRVVLSVLLCVAVLSGLPQAAVAQSLTRGPYLQQGTPSSVVVRWRTTTASNSRVRYGTDPANLITIVDNPASTTEHLVTVSMLTPNTKYYYAIGTTSTTLAGGDANHFFHTAPPAGTEQPIRIWALGDSGTANADAVAVRNAYLSLTGSQYTNVWLMLGDNAYNDGTDSEYQTAVFNMYPTMLRQTVLWPTLGNHDGQSANSLTQTGPYYDIFTLPKGGESGGAASGTEAYYAFNYGNVHFVVLDSYETNRAANGAMLTWLRLDLAQNKLPWVIAFWHHPPYTKGSHNSDTEIELIEMRQNALPILEDAGVDLVLTGHSHSYERSFLIDGHYGLSNTFNATTMKIDGGSGRNDETGGEYQKPDGYGAAHAGAVYVVAGSSGQISGGTLDHPAMFISLNRLGSVVLDVNGNTLDVFFLSNTGPPSLSLDHFSIVKGPVKPTVTVAATDATATEAGITTGTFTVTRTEDTAMPLTVSYNTSGTATAGSDYTALPGSVTIPSGATTATITVTPINDTLGENPETVVVTVTANAAYTVGSPSNATVTISSDELPPPTVTVAATDATATEAGRTTGTLTVSRTGSTTAALEVWYSVSGTAAAGSDYSALAGSLTIPIGAASTTIIVTPLDDPTVESNETVVVILTANAAYTVGVSSSATVTISSDDGNLPTVTITAPDAAATEAGPTTGTVQITRSGGNTAAALTVRYNVSGTATPGSDYTTLAGNRTILAGALSLNIPINPMNDTLVEGNETVILTLAPDPAYSIGSSNSATVTITSDDTAPPPAVVSIVASDATATEAGLTTTGTFTVSRTGATTTALTINYSVSGTATAGSDYTALAGSVTIPNGAASAPITVTPLDDTLSENNETVIATVTAQAAYTVGSPSSATVTISSDDGTPPGTTVNLPVTHAYDNKTGKTYRQGGPDGADPLNDLNTLSEEYKVEIEPGTGFWWEASYADPTVGNGNPQGVITIHYRSETAWAGTFTVEYYNGSTVLASVNLPVDSRQDPAAGKGQKGIHEWDLSAVINTTSDLAAARVRFINRASNGKKVWVTYSLLKATF